MNSGKRAHWRCSLALAFLLLSAHSASQSFGDDNRHSIDAAYPVGSATYFLTCSASSDGPPDMHGPIPATLRTARQILRALEAEQRRQRESESSPSTPGWCAYHLTVTVWSDSTLQASDITLTTISDARQILDRLERAADSNARVNDVRRRFGGAHPLPRPIPASEIASTDANHNPGSQCMAQTQTGQRCKRTAKGTTGLCWQHQEEDRVYAD